MKDSSARQLAHTGWTAGLGQLGEVATYGEVELVEHPGATRSRSRGASGSWASHGGFRVPCPSANLSTMAQAAVQRSSTEQLVRVLLSSLSPMADERESAQAPPEPDPELTAELQRRRRAYLAGELESVSLEELEHDLAGVLAAVHR